MKIMNIENLESLWLEVCQTNKLTQVKNFLMELEDNLEYLESQNFYMSELCRVLSSPEIIRYLLKTYPSIDICAYNNEPLMSACSNKQDIVQLLLTSRDIPTNASPDARNGLALFTALMHQKYDIAQYLISHVDYFKNHDIHAWISEASKYSNGGYARQIRPFLVFLLERATNAFFENTVFNLTFFITFNDEVLIQKMMEVLAKFDPFRYIEYLPTIRSWCEQSNNEPLYHRIKMMRSAQFAHTSEEIPLII